ncbi:carbon-nitrogen hydrolase [Aspergillus crustosus]
MSSRTVRVSVVQAEPAWLDLDAGVEKTCKLAAEAAQNGAQLIAFPELWLTGYPCWIWSRPVDPDLGAKYIKNSIRVDSPELEAIQTCARENSIAISFGASENSNNSLYISQFLIDQDGKIAIHRRKIKPTHMERTIFGDGSENSLRIVEELSFARVGGLSCWEHLQPLLKYHSITQRPEIHVAAWPVLDQFQGGGLWSMSVDGCENLSRTYAAESGAFVLHCTTIISEQGIELLKTTGSPMMSTPGGGYSAVYGPDGRRLTEPLDDRTEGLIYANLDLDAILTPRMFLDTVGHYSRPDILWLGVDASVKSVLRGE